MIRIHLPTKVSHKIDGSYSMWFQVDSNDEDDGPLEIYIQLFAQMMGWA